MMKKILSLMVSCILIVSFAACDLITDSDELGSMIDDIPLFDKIPSFDDIIPFDSDKSKRNPDILELKSTEYYESNYQTKNETNVYVKYNKVYLTEECAQNYPALNTAINSYTAENEKNCLDSYNTTARDVQIASPGSMSLYDESDIYVRRADKNFVSLLNYSNSYSGGAHGYAALLGANFETATGRKLLLSDIVADANTLAEQIYSKIIQNHKDYLFDDSSTKDYIQKNINDISFVLEYTGLSVFFNPYEIAPYSSGIIDVFIPYEEISGLILTNLTDIPSAYAVQLAPVGGYRFSPDNNAIFKKVTVSAFSNEYEMIDEETIFIDDAQLTLNVPAYNVNSLYIHSDNGKNYLNITFEQEDVYGQTQVYEIGSYATQIYTTDDSYRSIYADVTGNTEDIVTDPGSYYMGRYFSHISTVNAFREVYTDEYGRPTPADESGLYTVYDDLMLTLKKSLSVNVINEKSGKTEKSTVLNPGDTITYYRTDGQRISDFKTNDGRIVRIETDSSQGWPRTINGDDIENIFDGLLFAG